ncbi:hypothetical protein L0156_05980 [bacterium]|nr:hypothetical protein [bacterium]
MTDAKKLTAKLLIFLIFIVILAFLLCVIIPGNPFFFTSRTLLYFSLGLVLFKGFWDWRTHNHSRFLEILPFLILFLFASLRVSRFQEYRFGVDDAYYYSYVSSIFIDGDLELSNQYKLSKLEKHLDEKVLLAKTPAGYSANIYPAGLSFYWSPFFLSGHLLAKLFDFPLNGYSRPYTHAILVGNLFYVCGGLYITYLFCNSFFLKLISLISTAAISFTTPYLRFYFHSLFLLSESLAFALTALFLFLVLKNKDKHLPYRWFAIGIFFGTLTMVRLQNAILVIVPLALLYFSISPEKRTQQFLRLTTMFATGSVIGFLPQLIVWRVINGDWFFSGGGSFLPYWKSPFILETLFSARNSLFPWSPVTVLSVIGLILLTQQDRLWGRTLLTLLIVTIWMNSAHYDWWGAASIGARRFVPICSIFTLGIAALLISLTKLGKIILVFCLVALIFLNSFLVFAIVRGLDPEHAVRFSDVLKGPYSVFQPVVYALQFPIQAAYRIRYGTPLYGPLTEFFIGEDIFYFQKRAGGQILSAESPIFGEGWIFENGKRQTRGPTSVLYVPLFIKNPPRIVIELHLLPENSENDVRIDFHWNGKLLRSRKISTEGRQLELAIRSRDCRTEVNELRMRIYDPKSEDTIPTVTLQQIHFQAPLDIL